MHRLSASGGTAIGSLAGRRGKLLYLLLFFGVAAIFGLSYTQSVLYEGNQNTKFLHGLAWAGQGLLQEDWLANTIDPLPAFSSLVFLTAKIDENLFYLYYAILMGVYVFSLVGISNLLFNKQFDIYKSMLLFTALLIVHGSWFILMAQRTANIPLQYFHYGVADQYLLGEEFQNSSFGVLLLASIYLFLKRRYGWAVIMLGVSCILHSAYLFSGALLMLAYLGIIFWENWQAGKGQAATPSQRLVQALRQPFGLGILALVLVLPVVAYNLVFLSDTSAQASAEALRIIVHERIPHHSLPSVWMDRSAYFQFGLVLAGTLLALRSRLLPIMVSLLAGGLALTLVQIATKSDSLALLAPWRVSVLLVPMATTLIASFFIYVFVDVLRVGRTPYALVVIPLFLVTSYLAIENGIYLQERNNSGFRINRIKPLFEYVSSEKSSGSVYLIPPLDAEFDDFRLRTGAPIFINWKSHPYKDVDVLEWYQRVVRADEFYSADVPQKCSVLEKLMGDFTITDVVIESKVIRLDCSFAELTFDGGRYVVYALEQP